MPDEPADDACGYVFAIGFVPLDHGDVDAVERFGATLRKARLAHGWTQEDLAEKTGLAIVQVSRIERGKREVRLTTFTRLVRALGVPPAELLKGVV